MNKDLVTEFSTEWIKYSEYTTKKQPFGDEYIVPKKNAKPIHLLYQQLYNLYFKKIA